MSYHKIFSPKILARAIPVLSESTLPRIESSVTRDDLSSIQHAGILHLGELGRTTKSQVRELLLSEDVSGLIFKVPIGSDLQQAINDFDGHIKPNGEVRDIRGAYRYFRSLVDGGDFAGGDETLLNEWAHRYSGIARWCTALCGDREIEFTIGQDMFGIGGKHKDRAVLTFTLSDTVIGTVVEDANGNDIHAAKNELFIFKSEWRKPFRSGREELSSEDKTLLSDMPFMEKPCLHGSPLRNDFTQLGEIEGRAKHRITFRGFARSIPDFMRAAVS